MPSKREVGALVACGTLTLGMGAALLFPDQTESAGGSATEAVIDIFQPKEEVSTTAAAACYEISTVDTRLKIGALIITLADVTEPGQMDVLQQTMQETAVSGFATLNLEDTVHYKGQPTPIATATTSLITEVEAANGVNVTFALDEEGGMVQRSKNLMGFTRLPSARDQAALPPAEISSMFTEHGQKLRTLGVDVVFGPVADSGHNDPIGSRAFAATPESVVGPARAVIEGLHAAGIDATIKHYPDHGNATGDTHVVAAKTPPLSELESNGLPAFTALFPETDMVMVAHTSTEGLTAPNEPASLSPAVYSRLRADGFTGVAITDGLGMDAIQAYVGAPDEATAEAKAAVIALQSGADMVIVDLGSTRGVVNAVSAAVASSEIPAARLDEAAKRVLSLKGYQMC